MKTLPVLFLMGLTVIVAGAGPADPDAVPGLSPDRAEALAALDQLEHRISSLRSQAVQTEDRYESEIRPVQAMLMSFTADTVLASRIALSLVRESRDVELSPRLLASVLLVENPWLEPDRRSFVGAVGLMQVMPFHAGDWGCPSSDLEAIEANICHGARIFANALKRSKGDMDRALLRYNGCVRGTNTPNCFDYPTLVYAQAGKAQMNAWFSDDPRGVNTAGS